MDNLVFRADGPDQVAALRPGRPGRSGTRLLAAALICLVAAGALSWRQQEAAVFARLVDGALAWCV